MATTAPPAARSPLLAGYLEQLRAIRAGDAFAMLLAHERRHLWQLRRIIASPGFPRG
jgi:hypothetical protein